MSALIDQLSGELRAAERDRVPVVQLSRRYPEMTVDDAYEIQLAQQRHHQKAGRVLVGRKIGLTSLAMQQQLGIEIPDFGYFFADMVDHDGATVSASRYIAPRIEPEFAFVLGTDLTGPRVTPEEAGRAVVSVHAALEIIDSRIADWKITLVDTIADNASCGSIVVGPQLVGVDPLNLADVACDFVIDGVLLRTGHGRDVLGDPLAALAWLANTLGERGVTLEAGQTVLPGAFVAAEPVASGTRARADFGSHGAVEIVFGD